MSTKEQEFSYLKYEDNLKPYNIAMIDTYSYKVGRRPLPDFTLTTNQREFKCDAGKLWFTYSHFPHNCGIGVYSGIVIATTQGKESELETLYKEFIHFMRNTCDKDMILLSDSDDGIIAEMADHSDGQLKPIGKRVMNDNSDNYIKMYQTTRQSTDYELFIEVDQIRPGLLSRVTPEVYD